jgi:site-specific recombinase XerD
MLTTEACIKQFIDDHSFKCEKSTLDSYKRSIEQLLCFSKKQYHEITKRDIRNWLVCLTEEGYKVSSISKKFFDLRVFFKYCVEEELISNNPVEAITPPKSDDKLPYYLTNEQLTQLRHICSGKLKQRAIIEVLYTTGVRISELTNMKLEDINWSERLIHIPKGKGKKERIVMFTKECEEHLKAYLNQRSDELPFVFLNRLRTGAIFKTSINYWFYDYRKKLGIHVTPHTLRHTFAAQLARKGMPLSSIQALLGHEDASMTQRYARLHQQAQKEMYDEWM